MSSPAYEPAHCVVCGHTEASVVAEHDDIRREVEELWEYHGARLRPGTPSHALFDRVTFSQHPPFRLVRCTGCGLLYRNPAEREHELEATYAGDAIPADVLRSLRENQLATARVQARAIKRLLGRGGSGLEVGSYVGAFLAAARGEDLHMEGLDINPGVNAFARASGFSVHDGTLVSYAVGRTFDVVAIWNTFDQLADPRAALGAARALVRRDGIFALRVPNGAFYAAARRWFDRGYLHRVVARTLLAQNNLLSFPYRWGFSVRSLTRLLSETGFAINEIHGDALVPTADRWTRAWARLEDRVVRSTLAGLARRAPQLAPWLEVYARRR